MNYCFYKTIHFAEKFKKPIFANFDLELFFRSIGTYHISITIVSLHLCKFSVFGKFPQSWCNKKKFVETIFLENLRNIIFIIIIKRFAEKIEKPILATFDLGNHFSNMKSIRTYDIYANFQLAANFAGVNV